MISTETLRLEAEYNCKEHENEVKKCISSKEINTYTQNTKGKSEKDPTLPETILLQRGKKKSQGGKSQTKPPDIRREEEKKALKSNII